MIHCKKASKKCSSLKKKKRPFSRLARELTPCTLLMKPPTCRSWAARVGPRSDANMPRSNSSNSSGSGSSSQTFIDTPVLGNLPPLIGNPYNGYINPYYWVDDHPLLYGNVMGV